jgi:hypothetical protein
MATFSLEDTCDTSKSLDLEIHTRGETFGRLDVSWDLPKTLPAPDYKRRGKNYLSRLVASRPVWPECDVRLCLSSSICKSKFAPQGVQWNGLLVPRHCNHRRIGLSNSWWPDGHCSMKNGKGVDLVKFANSFVKESAEGTRVNKKERMVGQIISLRRFSRL